jgi:hypothetical protein
MGSSKRRASWLRYARKRRAAEYAARTPEEWEAIRERRRAAAAHAHEVWLAMLADETPVGPGIRRGDIARLEHASATSLALRARWEPIYRARLVERGIL